MREKGLPMFLACTLKTPHASAPTVETEVFINEERHDGRRKRWERVEWHHRIALPPPETWTLDTIRAVLTTLRRFLPAHELGEAQARIDIYGQRPVKAAVLAVRARGWEAEVYAPSLRGADKARTDRLRLTGQLYFSEPMIAALKDLRAESPIPLAKLAPIDADITDTPMPSTGLDRLDLNQIVRQLPEDKQSALLVLLRAALRDISTDRDEDE
jgi:hypothetical protein